MLIHYPAARRGYTRLDWLESYHSFSFGDFYDAERMGVSVLRVLNDDVVHGGGGFGAHPHRDMEIITYMVSGTIEHQDSLGHKEQIAAGEVQRMTAGTGIVHSEYNPSSNQPLRLIQIWIKPARAGLPPSYEQMAIPLQPGLTWLAAGEPLPGTLRIHQDAKIGRVIGVDEYALPLAAGRIGFLQIVQGSAVLADLELEKGDGVVLNGESNPSIVLAPNSEALWFDLPAYGNAEAR
jgi:redox-sensitive bicupin YhaK (pirin superfamily)